MLKKIQLSLLVISVTLFVMTACQNDPASGSTDDGGQMEALDTLSFGRATFKEISKSCVTDTVRCAEATVSYPTVRSANAAVAEQINTTLRSVVANSVGLFGEADSTKLKPREAAKAFVSEFDKFLEESPDYFTGWASETNGEVIYEDQDVLTVEMNTYAFTGGAHPNGYVRLLNFDLNSGALLESSNLVQDTTALKQLAEKAFRSARELEPTTDLKEEGFWFENGFTLPAEMGMTKEGLKLFYNAYEVGPYAMGTTEFTIPTTALEGILVKK
ncbi:MAG: DUF3298 and DUF4163 domain-containing protein [Saprospiraceae bacterium]